MNGSSSPYCSWFVLLAAVTAMLWWYDTESYDKLCLMMFSGMTLCLMIHDPAQRAGYPPHGGGHRPRQPCDADHAAYLEGRCLGQRLPVHPLPELRLHGAGLSQSKLAKHRPALKAVAWV